MASKLQFNIYIFFYKKKKDQPVVELCIIYIFGY